MGNGAWEQPQANVLGGILHVDTTTLAWSIGFRNLLFPGQFLPVAGMPYDMARNTVCMRALEVGASHVFFLDSDVIPPPDAVMRLLAHNQPVISGMYCRRSPPAGVPVMIKNGQWVTEFTPNSVVEVDVVGAGCLLIRRDVLEKLPPCRTGSHWFDWRVNMRGAGVIPDAECMSEDFTFCLQCRKELGIKILVDTSIACKHVGFFECGYGTAAPMVA